LQGLKPGFRLVELQLGERDGPALSCPLRGFWNSTAGVVEKLNFGFLISDFGLDILD
jgi:hypothetical protein